MGSKEMLKGTNNDQGYISNWLICGPVLSDLTFTVDETDQYEFENKMRRALPNDEFEVPSVVAVNMPFMGDKWKFYECGNGIFVDLSYFYRLLCRVDFYAATQIISDCEQDIPLQLWSYPATDVWVNGKIAFSHVQPYYKPMYTDRTTVHLSEGVNNIFVRCQNLGVRDTRNIVGLQIPVCKYDLINTIPGDRAAVESLLKVSNWINKIELTESFKLQATEVPSVPCTIKAYTTNFADNSDILLDEKEWSTACDALSINKDAQKIVLSATVGDQYISRTIELPENEKPHYLTEHLSLEEHRRNFFTKIGELHLTANPEKTSETGVYYVLARMAMNGGKISDHDKAILLQDMEYVHARNDCSDFAMSALLRLFLTYSVTDRELLERMHTVALNFRYWMDEDGDDGMCFWSENHTLMFNGCQMMAGLLYPDEVFVRSNRTGRQMVEIATERCRNWLTMVERRYLEEFLSAGYSCITMAAVLVLIDFAPDESVRARAEAFLSLMFERIAIHSIKGSPIGPMGRVYRNVIIPHSQGIQAIMHYISPSAPVSISSWLSPMATSRYNPPASLLDAMNNEIQTTYITPNAEIYLAKSKDALLSSVSIPSPYVEGVSSKNTMLEPGVFGYQQHIWSAALAPDCLVFINHPAAANDASQLRPGYWYGNGLLPSMKQEQRLLGGIYHLDPERHPISFVHLFWPSHAFDKQVVENHWAFGQRDDGYVAVWMSGQMVPFNDMLFRCEYRVYGTDTAFVCVVGSKETDGSFDSFVEKVKALEPKLWYSELRLQAGDDFNLVYTPSQSQVITW